jgi:hypothetical protein
MQVLPIALILCSSALASDAGQLINDANNAQISGIPQPDATKIQSGKMNEQYKGSQTLKINGQDYKVVYDSNVQANGNLDFKSFDNLVAEGALQTSGTLVIDSIGKVGYYLAMNGRVKYVNNILESAGAIHAVGDAGDQDVDISVNGYLTCHRSNMTCTRVYGSYDVSILTKWLKYANKGNLDGVASLVNGNVAFTGSHSSQEAGKYVWVGNELKWVPAETKDTPTATKSSTATTTAAAKKTTEPNSAVSVGTSMMAVVAGVAAFFF